MSFILQNWVLTGLVSHTFLQILRNVYRLPFWFTLCFFCKIVELYVGCKVCVKSQIGSAPWSKVSISRTAVPVCGSASVNVRIRPV